jgi:hypothetical protein
MKGPKVSSAWRTVQQFISAQGAGIFEVEVETDTKDIRCTCPVFSKKGSCKHIQFVNDKIKYTGHYSIMVPNEVPEEMALDANTDAAKFREFVVKYAKIEVL